MAFVTDKYKQTDLQTEQQDSHLADAIDMKKIRIAKFTRPKFSHSTHLFFWAPYSQKHLKQVMKHILYISSKYDFINSAFIDISYAETGILGNWVLCQLPP